MHPILREPESHPLLLPPSGGQPVEVLPPLPPERLAAEVRALPADQTLVEHGDFTVLFFRAHQAPALTWELGRQRELTFRLAGEGSGRALDLDRYDAWYQHLVLWHGPTRQLVGGYRLGCTELICEELGAEGLYTRSLWRFDQALLAALGPALELGRSFIRPEAQKGPVALSLLWRGIGAWLVANPRCRRLLGPVSIDRRYRDTSIQLMAGHLLSHHGAPHLAALVEPTTPLVEHPGFRAVGERLPDLRALDVAVAELEPDERGVPVLLRQYLKLGAQVLCFNVDPDFADVVDALIVVDLDRTERRRLCRFMGEVGLAAWEQAAAA